MKCTVLLEFPPISTVMSIIYNNFLILKAGCHFVR